MHEAIEKESSQAEDRRGLIQAVDPDWLLAWPPDKGDPVVTLKEWVQSYRKASRFCRRRGYFLVGLGATLCILLAGLLVTDCVGVIKSGLSAGDNRPVGAMVFIAAIPIALILYGRKRLGLHWYYDMRVGQLMDVALAMAFANKLVPNRSGENSTKLWLEAVGCYSRVLVEQRREAAAGVLTGSLIKSEW